MLQKYYAVYIITNQNNTTLYIGITNNLIRRIYEHKNKLHQSFSSKYNLSKLVYYEFFEDPENAIKREKTLKNLVRRKKDKLVNDFNPKWRDLYNTLF